MTSSLSQLPAPGGASEQVQEFYKPAIVAATQIDAEPGTPAGPMSLLRGTSSNHRWACRKDHLLVAGLDSNGLIK